MLTDKVVIITGASFGFGEMSNIDEGTLVIVFSSIGVVTTIALYTVFPLPIAWKRFKQRYLEHHTETSYDVDIPALMAVTVYCYNLWGMVYVVARTALLPSTPFHYACLMWCYMNGSDFVSIYYFIYMLTKDMRYDGPRELKAFFYGLFVNIFAIGVVVLYYFLDTTTVNMFTCIVNTVLGIIMYASPLPVLINRRKMETVQYFPLWISVLFFFNALAWFLVALVASPFDPYLLITNGVGAALGVLNFGIIAKSTWSTEIPHHLVSFITMIREKGFFYTDVQVNEKAKELKSKKDDFSLEIV